MLHRSETETKVVCMLGFVNHFSDMQQRLGRNAANVQANPAEVGIAFNKGDVQAEISSAKCGRVTAGTTAEYHYLGFDVSHFALLNRLAARSFRQLLGYGNRGKTTGGCYKKKLNPTWKSFSTSRICFFCSKNTIT